MRPRSVLASGLSVGLALLDTCPPQLFINTPTQHHDLLTDCPDYSAGDACA